MADLNILTYESLYEMLRMEKFRTDLQKIPSNFLQSVKTYLEEKSKIIERQQEKDSSMFQSEVVATQRQLENVKKIIREIYDRRESKIIQSALFTTRSGAKDVHNLLEHEKEFYQELVEHLEGYRTGILRNLLENKSIIKPKPKSIKKQDQPSSHHLLRFKEAVPRFMAENSKVYGPFDVEDVAMVPIRASKILMKNKKVEVIGQHEKTQTTEETL